jgi:cytochrome c biogenesis protein CcdA
MVLPILAAAAATGTPWWGAVLLFIFGLAGGVSLLLVGTATGLVMRVRRLTLWVPKIERAGGSLLFITAPYFLCAAAAGLRRPFSMRGWMANICPG